MRATLKVLGESGGPKGPLYELACEPPNIISIGRSDDNQLVLKDGAVSSRHARVIWLRGSPCIEDLKSSNGTLLNGKAIKPSYPLPLKAGDCIEIFPYRIVFEQKVETSSERPRGHSIGGSPGEASGSGHLQPGRLRSGPPSELHGEAGYSPSDVMKHLPDRIEQDRRAHRSEESVDVNPLAQHISPAIERRWDETRMPKAADGPAESRPKSSSGISMARTTAHTHDESEAMLLRTVTEAFYEMLAAREKLKNEIRADHTLWRPSGNNPLKRAPTAEHALELMKSAEGESWLGTQEAITEAALDIKAHELAMLVGMREAFRHMLKVFSPENIVARADRRNRGPFSRLTADARYWHEYKSFYEESTSDAEDSWLTLFGQAFRKAYEREERKVRASTARRKS